ncbi:MAG: recombinase RecT, partial [bacterium]
PMSTSLQKNPQADNVNAALIKQKGELSKVLGSKIPAEYFVRAAMTAMRKNPLIYQCTQTSLLQCLMDLAQIRLVPDSITGEAYLIPFQNKGIYECQLMIGYQGYLKLVRQSNTVTNVYASVVYENDEFEISFGSDRRMHHKPLITGDRGAKLGAVAYVAYGGGDAKGEDFTWVPAEYIERVKKQARGASSPSSPWAIWPEPMWAKTALKQLCKTANLSPDVREQVSRAVDLDDASIIDVKAEAAPLEPQKSQLVGSDSPPPTPPPAAKKKVSRRRRQESNTAPPPVEPNSPFGDDEPPMGDEEPNEPQPHIVQRQPEEAPKKRSDELFD